VVAPCWRPQSQCQLLEDRELDIAIPLPLLVRADEVIA
jgi:hypothetical protein